MLLRKVNILVAFIILIFIIFTGVILDMIEVAKIAIKLIKNADKAASICNDIIDDICRIVSEYTGIFTVAKVTLIFSNINVTIISTVMGIIIGVLTIVDKSLGKNLAIRRSNDILFRVSKILYLLKKDR